MQSITLLYEDDNRRIVNSIVKSNAKVEIKNLLDMPFSIHMKGLTLEYDVEMVPEEFIEHIGFGPFFKRVANAHLENDGCIYLIATSDKKPLTRHVAQPKGFPLCPKKR